MNNGFFDFPDRLPINDAANLGWQVTVLGVVVVFVALVLLIVLTFVYPKFFGWLLPKTTAIKTRMADKKAARQLAKAQRKQADKATIVSVDKSDASAPQIAVGGPADDAALIAVITGAIAASLGTSSNGIRIKSLRRSGKSTPAWGREGKYEQFRF